MNVGDVLQSASAHLESIICLLFFYKLSPTSQSLRFTSAASCMHPVPSYWMPDGQPRSVDAMTLSAPGHWRSWHQHPTKRPTLSCNAYARALPVSASAKHRQIIRFRSSAD